ncbi:MAG: hypothetical protein HW415_957 [Deltaproteobacteria bacterium]|nr:hypothetical protein [Deltaproteobacteria bacterium]
MKKILLTFALAIAMSVPAFAATTITADWEAVQSGAAQYVGTQDATVAVGDSANGLLYSRHNLSSYGEHYQATTSVEGTSTATGITPLSVITTEVCVFCHTPHFGRVDTAPLWNRGSSATGYVAYGTTVGGTAITSVGGSSLACLSCHDGVTTLDNIINKPGKGSRTNGTGADLGWVFGEIGTGDTIGDTTAGGSTIGGATKGASRLNIGANNAGSRNVAAVDLSNDHPINVTYNAGTVASLRPTATTISSLVMDNARTNASDPGSTFGRSDNLWASRGFISNSVTIADVLRDTGKVQCASCHDPHYKNQTNSDPAVVANSGGVITSVENDGLFLRRVGGNSNSGVCRTCHNK